MAHAGVSVEPSVGTDSLMPSSLAYGVIVFFGDPPHSIAKPRPSQPGLSGSAAPREPADVFGEVHPGDAHPTRRGLFREGLDEAGLIRYRWPIRIQIGLRHEGTGPRLVVSGAAPVP